MKKVITKPDGTKEEIDGSPSEIAEYEKQSTRERQDESGKVQKSNRRVLKDEIQRLSETNQRFEEELRKIIERGQQTQFYPYRVYYPYTPIPWIDGTWCGRDFTITMDMPQTIEFISDVTSDSLKKLRNYSCSSFTLSSLGDQ